MQEYNGIIKYLRIDKVGEHFKAIITLEQTNILIGKNKDYSPRVQIIAWDDLATEIEQIYNKNNLHNFKFETITNYKNFSYQTDENKLKYNTEKKVILSPEGKPVKNKDNKLMIYDNYSNEITANKLIKEIYERINPDEIDIDDESILWDEVDSTELWD